MTTTDNMPQVKAYWNDTAHQFDAIYMGNKSVVKVVGRLYCVAATAE